MKFYYATALALLGSIGGAQAQTTAAFGFEYYPVAKVVQGADTLRNAWAGGLAAPQFSSIDLNGDGNKDLFVFDRTNGRVFTFLSVARGTGRAWEYAPDYAALFPEKMVGWALLRDYNCDNIPDLLTSINGGQVRLYRNVPQNGRPRFQDMGVLQQRLNSGALATINVSGSNMPDFRDVNGDGKPDLVTYDFLASNYMTLYTNDTPGSCGSTLPVFLSQPATAWGNILACNNCSGYQVPGQSFCFTAAKTAHSQGHNVLLVDLDGDGDQDVLDGRDNCPELSRLINAGTNQTASFPPANISSSQFPTTAQPARTVNYPAGYLLDADFDGKEDLVVSPNIFDNETDRVSLRNSVNLYRNTTATGSPPLTYDYVPGGFLENSMIDVSEGAAPAFGDLDGDGLPDMLVANTADRVNGVYRATLSHYRNVGTATRPVFSLVTTDYMGLSAGNFREMRPALVDLNRDGKLDLAYDAYRISENRLFFQLNTAPAGQPALFSFAALDSLQLAANPAVSLPFYRYDTPCFTDVDNDGFVDLLIGTIEQRTPGESLRYFRNTGTGPLNAAFVLANSDLGQIRDGQGYGPDNLSPTVADFDGDGSPDLITWDRSGSLTLYSNYRNQPATFVGRTSMILNRLTNTYEGARLGSGGKIHNALAAADLDGDNVPELLVGTQTGGVVSFRVTRQTAVLAARPSAAAAAQTALAVQVYPNPATDAVTVEAATITRVALLDLLGRTVRPAGAPAARHELSLSGLAAGLYLVRAESSTGTVVVRRLEVR